MSFFQDRSARLILIGLAAFLGGLCGFTLGVQSPAAQVSEPIGEFPLPHHVPRQPGGISLRFAMVHDVLHERFARHGKAYYEERNRRARQAIEKEPRSAGRKPSAKYFAAIDDLGVGLDHLGQDDEAVHILRDKLRQQQALRYQGRDLYTTYANLGTFLIHGNFARARNGDPEARRRLREGIALVQKAIEVNPDAHFGRETWQVVTAEFLDAAIDHPDILLDYDLVGDRLRDYVDPSQAGSIHDRREWAFYAPTRVTGDERYENRQEWENARLLRDYITRVGSEHGWREALHRGQTSVVPFDEPSLGIVGMWRLGGGANPHFALALGEIMLRVGQRYIAWCAYERAARLAGRFWPNRRLQEEFTAHCRRRQTVIEEHLAPEEGATLRPRFEAELDYGQHYQQAYEQYEAERIAAGTPLDDPHFYDAFHRQHEPIASPSGPSETYAAARQQVSLVRALPHAVLGAGLLAFVVACGLRLLTRRAPLAPQASGHVEPRTGSAGGRHTLSG